MTTPSQKVNSMQSGFTRLFLVFGLIVGISVLIFFKISEGKVAAATSMIKSGVAGFCLDNNDDGSLNGSKVVLWNCNDSTAQNWSVNGDHVEHYSACLSVQADSKAANSDIVTNNCNGSPGQVWLKDGDGYFNPNSTMCLTASGPYRKLVITPCSSPLMPNQIWATSSLKSKQQSSVSEACHGTEGERVACYAEKEWINWQSGTVNHSELLYKYTDGASYEAWCADFVSYVYKEAGYPFTPAYDGWDENNANNIQNYNFTLHLASSGYVPKPGDVAYFDYSGGHVEVVVSGGKNPTFIYGNSATIDPTTGNGQMEANTITNDGPEGQLIYYATPNLKKDS